MQTIKERISLTHVRPNNQLMARKLILEGLEEHWGTLDPALNQDLVNISETYNSGVFLLAWLDGKLVGTGALIPEAESISRIVRMSVEKTYRQQGIGKLILDRLIEYAHMRDQKKIVLETTATWQDAIGFYTKAGFRSVVLQDGDLHFELDLC